MLRRHFGRAAIGLAWAQVCCASRDREMIAELGNRSRGEGLGIGEPDAGALVVNYFDSTRAVRQLPESRYWSFCRFGRLLGQAQRGVVMADVNGAILARSRADIINANPAAVTADDRVLAFMGTNNDDGVTGLQFGTFDSSEFTVVYRTPEWPPGPDERLGTLGWSPDGQEIAYGRDGKILVYRLGSRESRVIGSGANPTWSPSGEWVGYRSLEGEACLVNPETGRGRRLMPGRVICYALHWSPDGEYVLFSEKRLMNIELGVYRLRGGATTVVSKHAAGPDDQVFEWVRLPKA